MNALAILLLLLVSNQVVLLDDRIHAPAQESYAADISLVQQPALDVRRHPVHPGVLSGARRFTIILISLAFFLAVVAYAGRLFLKANPGIR